MNKNNIFKMRCIFFTIILVIIIWVISILLKEYVIFNKNSKRAVLDYNIYYTVNSILDEYIGNLNSVFNDELNDDCFTLSSNIQNDKIKEILKIYEINNYAYEINLKKVYDLGFNTYKCEYELVYDGEFLGDYYIEEVPENFHVKEPVKYTNEVIIKLNMKKGKYKVLYNKFDLGGGNAYEK